jgi:hypothetical protein
MDRQRVVMTTHVAMSSRSSHQTLVIEPCSLNGIIRDAKHRLE